MAIGPRLPASERRAQLLEVACRAFAREGYRGTSMDAIAEAAGVTKPVLYQHFPSKQALYEGLLATEASRLIADLEQAFRGARDNHERIHRGFAAYLRFVDQREDAFRLLFTEALGMDATFKRHVDRLRHWVTTRIADITESEAGLPQPRARALAAAIIGMAEGAAAWWLAEGRPLSAEELASELAEFAWKGFARFPSGHADPAAPASLPG